MMRYLMIVAVLFVLGGTARADGESIRPCTDEEIASINEVVGNSMSSLKFFLRNTPDTIYDAIDDITIEQRALYHQESFIPDCTEKYTLYYPMGQILDDLSVAFGLMAGSRIAELSSEDRQAERLIDQMEKHIRYAKERMADVFPEDYRELFGED